MGPLTRAAKGVKPARLSGDDTLDERRDLANQVSANVTTPVDLSRFSVGWDGVRDYDPTAQPPPRSGGEGARGEEGRTAAQPAVQAAEAPPPEKPKPKPKPRKPTLEEANAWALAELARIKEQTDAPYKPAVQGAIDRTQPSAPMVDPEELLPIRQRRRGII